LWWYKTKDPLGRSSPPLFKNARQAEGNKATCAFNGMDGCDLPGIRVPENQQHEGEKLQERGHLETTAKSSFAGILI